MYLENLAGVSYVLSFHLSADETEKYPPHKTFTTGDLCRMMRSQTVTQTDVSTCCSGSLKGGKQACQNSE